jgi:type II secretory pathway predicted ATPase ExeA
LFPSQAWNQLQVRLQFWVDPHGAGRLTGEVGSGKSTAARAFGAGLHPSLYKILYLHWTAGSALDLLRPLARELDLEPAHYCGELVRQVSEAIVRLNQSKKPHDPRVVGPPIPNTCASASPCRITWRDSPARNWMPTGLIH